MNTLKELQNEIIGLETQAGQLKNKRDKLLTKLKYLKLKAKLIQAIEYQNNKKNNNKN